jgi:ABC-type Fe3+/spermidine/putrescine transport system ATPase subunit
MIRIEQLHFSVGAFALSDVSLCVAPGEYFVLLGPTGSGKTLLVECLCGLNRIESGRIFLGGNDVTALEPRLRNLGYLPQDYALFPHLSVRKNVTFGLRHHAAASAPGFVDRLMEQLGVAHLADRKPEKLSGGEKQRVALARALAIRPDVLLLDEPVSALDESTRDSLCRLLKQLQRDTHTTTLHVCHNFAEMLAVADRVGVIHQGRIVQVGTPQEVLQRPCNALVARFMQAGNLFAARATAEAARLRVSCPGGIELAAVPPETYFVEGDVSVMIRPENIRLSAGDCPSFCPSKNGTVPFSGKGDSPIFAGTKIGTVPSPPNATVLAGRLSDVVDLGPLVRVAVACGPEIEFQVSLGKREWGDLRLVPGSQVCMLIAAEDVHVMDE